MVNPLRKAAAVVAGEKPSGRKAVEAPRIEIKVNGVRIEVSPELEAAVHRVYKGMSAQLPPEMTTNEAAEFLAVSRPYVIKLVAQGDLPHRLVGRHRRIPTSALVEYREKMFQQAKKAADEMTMISQELGLYDLDVPPPKAK